MLQRIDFSNHLLYFSWICRILTSKWSHLQCLKDVLNVLLVFDNGTLPNVASQTHHFKNFSAFSSKPYPGGPNTPPKLVHLSPQPTFWGLLWLPKQASKTGVMKSQLFAPEPLREICSFRPWNLENGTPVIYRYVCMKREQPGLAMEREAPFSFIHSKNVKEGSWSKKT